MSIFNRSEERRCLEEFGHHDEEVIGSLCRLNDRASSPSTHMEQEKRIRREIANSNERRRMQSINAGFQSLRTLLPHHEGEKLSKAAILQQTAEYIYQLEQEKTSLLSQNCQLKRLINQHEGQHEASSAKKRKVDTPSVVVPLTAVPTTVSESSDEGIGSMSPEPVALIANSSGTSSLDNGDPSREMIELRVQLDRERRLRMLLEEQVRSLQSQLYPERIREITQQVQLQYHQEVIEHSPPTVTVTSIPPRCPQTQLATPVTPQPVSSNSNNSNSNIVSVALLQETAAAVAQLQVVSAASLPPVAQTTTIVSTSPLRLRSPTPPLPASPPPQALPSIKSESPCSSPPPPVMSPPPSEQRLPSVLEAAIKAEPKVEVERLPSPTSASDDITPQARLYLANTSRQNLETIVEAIRHLEGDHLFSDDPSPRCGQQQQHLPSSALEEHTQEAPLALTTHNKPVTQPTQAQVAHRLLKVEMNPYLQFHSSPQSTQQQRTALQQQRPGVIVVKQHT